MTEISTHQDGNRELFIDMPMREGKEGYIGMLYNIQIKFAAVLASDNFKDSDPRLYFITLHLISLIPDTKIRTDIKSKMKNDLNEIYKLNITDEEKNRRRNEHCFEVLGDIMEFVDQHVGISMKLDIGVS